MQKYKSCKEPDVDEGILEKIDRLVSEEIKVMHVGACRLDRGRKRVPKNSLKSVR
ncbi:MAG: hypothetical protein ACLTER_18680 [Ruminococcus sp.]